MDGQTNSSIDLDVYQRAEHALGELIAELSDALGTDNLEYYKRTGYQMVGAYSREPIPTGKLTMMFACVLQDILHKLELAEESETTAMIRDAYSVMKMEE